MSIRVFFVLNFVFRLFGFVSDLEFMASAIPYGRISDLPRRSVSAGLLIKPTQLTLACPRGQLPRNSKRRVDEGESLRQSLL